MPAPVNRASISLSALDLLLMRELADLTGQSLSAVASRAVSEWLVEHYEERRKFYVDAFNCGFKSNDAVSYFRPPADQEEGRSQRLYDATGGDATSDFNTRGDVATRVQSSFGGVEASHPC